MDKQIVLPFALMVLPVALLGAAGGAAMPAALAGGFETGIILAAFSAVVARIAARAVFRAFIESVVRVFSRGFSRLFLSSLAKDSASLEPGVMKMQSASILHRARIIDRLRARHRMFSEQVMSFVLCWLALGASLALTMHFKYSLVYWPAFGLVFVPLAVYVLAEKCAARILNTRHLLLCPVDAVLVQFYFAGAVSFLPLANESRLYGSERENGLVSLSGSIALFLLVLSFRFIGDESGMLTLITLLFLLISTFPVKPMAGNYVWRWSKAVSLASFGLSLEFIALFGSGVLSGII